MTTDNLPREVYRDPILDAKVIVHVQLCLAVTLQPLALINLGAQFGDDEVSKVWRSWQ
jgi:hypothetical protein